jgi:excisionase family DNA binding protein
MARRTSEKSTRAIISPVGGVYTSDEAAEILRTSRRTVQRLIREGKLQANRVGHGYRILDHHIKAFFASEEHQTVPNTAVSSDCPLSTSGTMAQ